MLSRFYKKFSIYEGIVIFIVFIGIGFFYVGFFYPDPYAISRWRPLSKLIERGMRIIIPLLTFMLMLLYYKLKTQHIKVEHIVLLLGGLLFSLLLCYPIADYFYHESGVEMRYKLERYHPYLQLAPHNFSRHKPLQEGQFSIMCLGGSTTEFKDSAGKGWPERVEEILQRHFENENIKVYNEGRQWYTTLHSLINYEVNLRQYKPDVLIVMHTINDLLHNADFCYFSYGSFREDYGHFYGPITKTIKHQGLQNFFVEHFRYFWYHKPRRVIEQEIFPGEIPFERNLHTLIDLAEKDLSTIVFMTQPSLYKNDITKDERAALYMLNYEAIGPDRKWSYNSAFNGFERYHAIVRNIAKNRGIILIDLEKRIPKSLEYFSDDVHYKDQTFDLIAKEVAEELINNNTTATKILQFLGKSPL
jgi:hypothetical protein